jgi:UDP-glucose 4-epimerase
MRILITGGAGFIGSHLCEELIKDKNNEIISLDNYSTGKEENHIEGVTYIKGNTKDIDSLIDVVPDMIYHLGEYSRTSESFNEPNKTWEYNTEGTFRVLEFARKNKIKKFLYAGSSTKLADGGDGRNQSPYAWTKATNTELVQRYGEWFGLPYVIVYFYNVFGGREMETGPYATLIGIFKRLTRAGETLTVVAPGTQLRSFTHVDDIVRGIILAGEKGSGDGYCLGPKEMFSVMDVAKLFGGEIKVLPEKPGDRKTVAIDLSKTEEELGWGTKVRLKDHIQGFLSEL